MKLATESQENEEVWEKPMDFIVDKGLIGFPDEREYELLVNAEELPFMWIRAAKLRELGFVVIEPKQILSDYEIEIADDDADSLEIATAEDALVLNIVTISDPNDIASATVNLVAPVIVNRNTMKGKQVIISNNAKYSTKHPILSDSANKG